MSNKGKSSALGGEGAGLVPTLRFPEFQEKSGWLEKPLSTFLTPIARDRVKPTEGYTGLGLRSHGKGTFLKELEDPAKNSMDVLYEVKREDLIVNITFAWEGAIAIAGSSDDGALVSHRFPTYTFSKDRVLPEFFKFKIVDKQFVYKLGLISPGGAGRNRVMNKTDFLKLKVVLPSTDEQQKIAECLDSADALIAAQGRKVEALRAHKKGLMQQLFPQQGETQPRFRFPEFEGTGEWGSENIDETCEIVNNRRRPIASNLRAAGPYPYYGASGIVDYVDDFIFDETLLLIGEDGAKWGAFERTAFLASGKYWVNNHAHVLRPVKMVDAFMANYLTMLDVSPYVTGAAPPKLTLGKLKEIQVPLPPTRDEQQRIADCLTSLDDLIAAETRKLDTLKTHKKGLMQKLFPAIEEFES